MSTVGRLAKTKEQHGNELRLQSMNTLFYCIVSYEISLQACIE